MHDSLLFSEFTNPFFSICVTYTDFRNSVQQFEKLSSSGLGFGIIWSEGRSSSQCCAADYYS